MISPLSRLVPTERLRRLEFLVGDFVGMETLYPPEADPIHFEAVFAGSWEYCERFVKFNCFAKVPTIGTETFDALITYDEKRDCYRMWVFATSQPEPVHLLGEFVGDKLVFISDPTPMMWGVQRLRFSFQEMSSGVQMIGQRWEPDGYVPYCSALLRPISAANHVIGF